MNWDNDQDSCGFVGIPDLVVYFFTYAWVRARGVSAFSIIMFNLNILSRTGNLPRLPP